MTDNIPIKKDGRQRKALRHAILIAGSQQGIANICGVCQTTVSIWLTSGQGVPLRHVSTVADFVGMHPSDLRPDIRDLFCKEKTDNRGRYENNTIS